MKYRRVSPGAPVAGFDSQGLPNYSMNVLPLTIEAENYDHFAVDGQGRTYLDLTASNAGDAYRSDDVDVAAISDGHALTELDNGEWVTYTVAVPEADDCLITICYSAAEGGGKIRLRFDGVDLTGEVDVPASNSNWQNLPIASGIALSPGVKSMRVEFLGTSNVFELDSIQVMTAMLGDVNRDGVVNFLDINPFIVSLTAGSYQEEADVNEDGFVNFLDIAPFIRLLAQ